MYNVHNVQKKPSYYWVSLIQFVLCMIAVLVIVSIFPWLKPYIKSQQCQSFINIYLIQVYKNINYYYTLPTSWYSPIGVRYLRMKNCLVTRLGGYIWTLPMTKVSNSAQEELLQSEAWNGDGRAGGGDMKPSLKGLHGSAPPSTLVRLCSKIK